MSLSFLPRLAVAAAAVCLLVVGGWLLFRERTLSANFKNERLDKVIAFYEKKTGLEIETSLDPSTPVTLFLQDAGVGDALETLAVAVDGRAGLHAVMAATKAEVNGYVAGMVNGAPLEGWVTHRVSIPGMGFLGESSVTPDPRSVPLAAPEAWPKGMLQDHLKVLAESSDVVWAAPASWNPAVVFDPGTVRVERAYSRLLGAAKGKGRFFVYLRGGFRGGDGTQAGPGPGQGGVGGAGVGGEGRRLREMPDPAVVARRMEQQIAALPADEQAEARKVWEADRAFWESLRGLTPEQRREKMQERMDDPAVQERMENAQAKQDARRSPEKRRDRYRDYLGRKQAATQ